MGLCLSAPVGDDASAAASGSKTPARSGKAAAAPVDTAGGAAHQHAGGSRAGAAPILGHWDDVKAHYSMERVLGKGQFGVTRLVVEHSTGQQFACKSISKRKLTSEVRDARGTATAAAAAADGPQHCRPVCAASCAGGR